MLHVQTPLIQSRPMSKLIDGQVLLKLENTQPAASFKIRGIGHACQKAKDRGCSRIVCSSGGNAGMAAAYAARMLGLPATIYVPGSTPQLTVDDLRAQEATVNVVGRIWDEANEACLKDAKVPNTAFIHPFDDPLLWEGHSSMVTEIAADLPSPPDCVIVSVGGGGLACGVLEGLEKCGWSHVPLVAVETEGAASLNAAMAAGQLVSIPDITSIAKSLGSRTVCRRLYDLAQTRPVFPTVVTDTESVNACLKFADHHQFLVEPACGASLAMIYSGHLSKLQQDGRLPADLKSVVVIVCGGSSVSLDLLQTWKNQFSL